MCRSLRNQHNLWAWHLSLFHRQVESTSVLLPQSWVNQGMSGMYLERWSCGWFRDDCRADAVEGFKTCGRRKQRLLSVSGRVFTVDVGNRIGRAFSLYSFRGSLLRDKSEVIAQHQCRLS